MFKINQASLTAHIDAAMKAAKFNDRESMDINLKWAKEKFERLQSLTLEEYMRAPKSDSAPPYQVWAGNRELIERNAGEMALDRGFRTYADGLETYNEIVKTYKNLRVEFREYFPNGKAYQLFKLRP